MHRIQVNTQPVQGLAALRQRVGTEGLPDAQRESIKLSSRLRSLTSHDTVRPAAVRLSAVRRRRRCSRVCRVPRTAGRSW
ncbi:hypothetical protein ACFZCU_47425 [Streptomyces canus]|uniref:hypothetical protein n=1 Tax=Streptomyces canus TaxID=58343 RepID=UPI0036EE2A7D